MVEETVRYRASTEGIVQKPIIRMGIFKLLSFEQQVASILWGERVRHVIIEAVGDARYGGHYVFVEDDEDACPHGANTATFVNEPGRGGHVGVAARRQESKVGSVL